MKKFAQFARRNLIEQVSAKLNLVLGDNSAARRESSNAIKALEEAISKNGEEQVVERVAYIWFNRFCALRFMDVNRYARIGVVSPVDGQFQPEILAEAKMGHIDEVLVPEKSRQQIFSLLDGQAHSRDPQGEAYSLLVVAACNYWNKAMPFLFQRIEDYTELLMPDDLLSGNSILTYTREAMTPGVCEDVEVIGWLYQFYISEKKDEVFAGLKKKKKITPENIPAATQLFTPHWIVRYLVENSLGRLWMLNRPNSQIFEKMKARGEDCYYIEPEKSETDFLRINKPEEIKICDPACGSGHMLTYAFNLLYAIYEEEGYEPAEIPEKILTNNLYGIEIDERAGELAAFALTMKARAKQRRFFNKGVKPNICVLENVYFDGSELKEYMDFVGRDLFTVPLQTTLRQFEEADNFGSLIRPDIKDVDGMLKILESKNVSGQLFLSRTHQKVLQALRQANYLSQKYHVVIANPPYMGGKGMNGRLSSWVKDNYPNSKSDLFAMFIERNLDLAQKHGVIAMITMQSWMFLTSFEALRLRLLSQNTLLSMAHLGPRAFDSIGGEVVSTTAFVVSNSSNPGHKGAFLRLVSERSEAEKSKALIGGIKDPKCGWFHRVTANDLSKIPGYPIAYWANENAFFAFARNKPISGITSLHRGISTGNNELFARLWHEVSYGLFSTEATSPQEAKCSSARWFPYNRGGTFRKWYGLGIDVIDYENGGYRMIAAAESGDSPGFRHDGSSEYFNETITWTALTAGKPSFRFLNSGYVLGHKGSSIKSPVKDRLPLLGLFNSNVLEKFLEYLSPTLDINIAQISALPLPVHFDSRRTGQVASELVDVSKKDWDSFETSWGFSSLPLLNPHHLKPTLKATYKKLRAHWWEMTLEMQRLEEENNRIFIDAYGLQDELNPKVSLNEITLIRNPHYRYGNDKSKEELEALLFADTMRELASYAVGCMFGRYALDKPGLILANQGESVEDYLRQIPEPTFPADEDNVIPMLDGNWFTDDIAERFRTFLRITFGEEHYEENLEFVENGLNIKNKRNYSIRDYFFKEFYIDHWKRYKKRPIYWLFSSPKGSFNALIYMHRYRPDTVSVVLNKYLREFHEKLVTEKNNQEAISISGGSSQGEKTAALKRINEIRKMIIDIEEYERNILYPIATKQVEIELDDGVKFNYQQFEKALKKVPGLSAK